LIFAFSIKKDHGDPSGRGEPYGLVISSYVPLLTPAKLAVGLGLRANPNPRQRRGNSPQKLSWVLRSPRPWRGD